MLLIPQIILNDLSLKLRRVWEIFWQECWQVLIDMLQGSHAGYFFKGKCKKSYY